PPSVVLVNNEPVSGNPYVDSPRWILAEQITAALRDRWPTEIRAIGAHGWLAHGEDDGGNDIDLLVVTYRPGAGPCPGTRRGDGMLRELGGRGAGEHIAH